MENRFEWFEVTDNIAEKLNELSKTYAIGDVQYCVASSPNTTIVKTYALIQAIRLDKPIPIFKDE